MGAFDLIDPILAGNTVKNAYDQGVQAYKDGADFYDNPHCASNSSVRAGPAWWAGWTFAKQQDKNVTGDSVNDGYDQGVPYVLKKNGMYYAHNSRGYVSQVLLAELYSEDYAKNQAKKCDECQAIPITELLTGPDEVQEYIDRMECMRDIMVKR